MPGMGRCKKGPVFPEALAGQLWRGGGASSDFCLGIWGAISLSLSWHLAQSRVPMNGRNGRKKGDKHILRMFLQGWIKGQKN